MEWNGICGCRKESKNGAGKRAEVMTRKHRKKEERVDIKEKKLRVKKCHCGLLGRHLAHQIPCLLVYFIYLY